MKKHPTNTEARVLLKSVPCRSQQQNTGSYNFKVMRQIAKSTPCNLDIVIYMGLAHVKASKSLIKADYHR